MPGAEERGVPAADEANFSKSSVTKAWPPKVSPICPAPSVTVISEATCAYRRWLVHEPRQRQFLIHRQMTHLRLRRHGLEIAIYLANLWEFLLHFQLIFPPRINYRIRAWEMRRNCSSFELTLCIGARPDVFISSFCNNYLFKMLQSHAEMCR